MNNKMVELVILFIIGLFLSNGLIFNINMHNYGFTLFDFTLICFIVREIIKVAKEKI